MKKHCILFFIILMSGIGATAQSRLEIHSAAILNVNSIHIGDTLIFYYSLYNSGTTTYNGDIKTYLSTNLDTVPMVYTLNSVAIDTGINDTFSIMARFAVQPPHFQENVKSIIVIWPTGTGTTIKGDTFVAKDVPIQSSVSIFEEKKTLSYVRFYPNPAKDLLHIELLKKDVNIKNFSLMDLQGRNIPINYPGFNGSPLYFGNYKAGVYLLEVEFTDGQKSKFRVIKTE